jgi:DNA-binding transcriptional MerR regulator
LLAPAEVDAGSGYRRYRPDQIAVARQIQALRWIDLPVDAVRQIVATQDSERIHQILTEHRQRLERQQSLLTARISDVNRYLEKGMTMPTRQSGCKPVQIKLAVDDIEASVAYYQEAFGFRYDVTRRTAEDDHSSFIFGVYGQDDFFLIHLVDDPDDTDRPGLTTFGLLVDDLDSVHSRAITTGGAEVVAPHSPEGMPRCSAVRDPSGNWVWLYQG